MTLVKLLPILTLMNMNMNKGAIVGILIAVVVLGGIGGGIWMASKSKVLPGPRVTSPVQKTSTIPNQATPSPDTSMSDTKPEVPGPVKEFAVTGSNYKFSPATITVKKGETVRITFKSTGGIHNLLIDELGVATSQLGDEEEEEVEFLADKSGTFTYYCSVGNHRQMGMVGKLVVQ